MGSYYSQAVNVVIMPMQKWPRTRSVSLLDSVGCPNEMMDTRLSFLRNLDTVVMGGMSFIMKRWGYDEDYWTLFGYVVDIQLV
jgi:hypothetical protein